MRQREDLEPAGVREHRAFPTHEFVNAAEALKHLRPRPQEQVISVGEQDLRTGVFQRLRGLRLHGRLGAHRHKERRLHLVVQRAESSGARTRPGGLGFEVKMQTGAIH